MSITSLRGRIEAFEETLRGPGAAGADALLAIDRQTIDSLTTELAVQVTQVFSWRGGALLPTVRLGVERELKNDGRTLRGRFGDGDPFVLRTADPDRTYFNLGAGLSAQFTHGRSAFVFLETVEGRSGVREHRIDVGLRMEF